ncbi:MAG: hypothetical protein QXO01_06460 [Nitrososphaerota archaeon]
MKKERNSNKHGVTIGLLLSDLRVAHSIVSEASRRGMEVLSVSSPAELPLTTKVIITSKKDAPKLPTPALFVEDVPSCKTLIDRAYEMTFGKNCVKFVAVSIDPGEKRIGCAFFAEDMLLRTSTYSDEHALLDDIDDFFNAHQGCKKYIIIGEGPGNFSYTIKKNVYEKFLSAGQVEIMAISENSSSQKNVFMLAHSPDENAALMLFIKARGRLMLSGK